MLTMRRVAFALTLFSLFSRAEDRRDLPPDDGPSANFSRRARNSNPDAPGLVPAPTPVSDNSERVFVDIGSAPVPTIPGMDRNEVARRGLNYLLNFTSTLPNLVTVRKENVEEGKVELSRFGNASVNRAFNFQKFLALERGRPPVIFNPKSECTEPGSFDLGFLAESMMSPKVYYQVAGFPDDWATLARRLGVSGANPTAISQNEDSNRIIKEAGDITASRGPRVLEFEARKDRQGREIPKRFVWRSTDFSTVASPGEKEFSDLKRHPGDFKGQAGEVIFDLDNGFHGYALIGADGKLQTEAPASIVHTVSSMYPKVQGLSHADLTPQTGSTVYVPSCINCHSGGNRGTGTGFDIKKFLADSIKDGRISRREASLAERDYIKGDAYDKQAKADGKSMRDAMEAAQADIPSSDPTQPAAILPMLAAAYEKPLDVAQMARELGFVDDKADRHSYKPVVTASAKLIAALQNEANSKWRGILGLKDDSSKEDYDALSVPRDEFNRRFCDLRSTLQKQQVLTPSGSNTSDRNATPPTRNTRGGQTDTH